jgi:hypothetical protein
MAGLRLDPSAIAVNCATMVLTYLIAQQVGRPGRQGERAQVAMQGHGTRARCHRPRPWLLAHAFSAPHPAPARCKRSRPS